MDMFFLKYKSLSETTLLCILLSVSYYFLFQLRIIHFKKTCWDMSNIDRVDRMPSTKTDTTLNHEQGLAEKGHAIKGLVV